MNKENGKIILALPKGRIFAELMPYLEKINIEIDPGFFDEGNRKLFFSTNIDYLDVVKCRSFDAESFVAYGAADLAICGLDVLKEFSYPNIYNILDLNFGKCRLSIAGSDDRKLGQKLLKIATKYPNITREYFNDRDIQTEIIKLNGSIEVAANLGICDYIVDLVSSGKTLKDNGLKEIAEILPVSSRLIVNRSSQIVKIERVNKILERFANV